MTMRRVTIGTGRTERRFVVEFTTPAEKEQIRSRLATLQAAGVVTDFNLESLWVDPFERQRLLDTLTDMEGRVAARSGR